MAVNCVVIFIDRSVVSYHSACVTIVRYQYVWKSVYPESIFDESVALLQQFELDANGDDASDSDVTVSSALTLGDTAASAVIAVTLTAMGKVMASF